jgi:tetratricopeptide (TPR) repeat protein
MMLALAFAFAAMPSGFGDHTRTVTTTSARAQDFFNEGLAYLSAFNHDEAARAFSDALKADPACAMCAAGVVLARGPNINVSSLPAAQASDAHNAALAAIALKDKGTAVEQGFIDALRIRHATPRPKDRPKQDAAYADAMRALAARFPDDADVAVWFAEALLTLRPFDQWTKDGAPQPGTEEALATLERVLARDADHPLANHLLIHALEASPTPERADAAAARLRTLAPGLGHLLHMPSHIDVRRGRFNEAVLANEAALRVDDAYLAAHPETGVYRTYIMHNRHMLAFAAMMSGQSQRALTRSAEIEAQMPQGWIDAAPLDVDGFLALRVEVLIRFGRWQEILKLKEPRKSLPLSRTMWRYARGVARAAMGDAKGARTEQKSFAKEKAGIPKSQKFGANEARKLADVAAHILAGEIALADSDLDKAVASLEKAVAAEDALRYDEPPDWILPARHPLGITLMKAARYDEAEKVYRADLSRWPDNVWSLWGLTTVLAMKNTPDAALERRFAELKAQADIELTTSCFCLPGI